MGGVKFEVFDCFHRRIYCDQTLWYGKLLAKHGITDKDEGLVKRAISQPEGGYPRYDYDDPKRIRIYYKQEKPSGLYIRVIVKFQRDHEAMAFGEVVSAYFEHEMNKREKPELLNDETF